MLTIRIYTNDDRDEYAIALPGDQAMRAETRHGILYPNFNGEYDIETQSDLVFISERIREALDLNMGIVDNCDESAEFECCRCLRPIVSHEAHAELVLYAGDDREVGMVAAMHNDCTEATEAEQSDAVTLYDSMYSYASGADISHYRLSGNGNMVYQIRPFNPANDPNFVVDNDHPIQRDGKTYIPVCWGEEESSALLASEIFTGQCWILYRYNGRTGEYVSDGRVYETLEDATAEQSAD